MATVQEFTATPESLAKIPELTEEAIEAARLNPEVGCLIDRVYPGAPLILCFSYFGTMLLRRFDFFGRTKKLEQRLGLKFNRILMRDTINAWYHRGVPGLGDHVDEVAQSLRSLIAAISPGRIYTVGQSMGGYAAILFGMLLGADRIAAFGPVSYLDPERARRDSDLRYLTIMQELRDDPPKCVYTDLVQLGRELDFRGELHVVFGTQARSDSAGSGNIDAAHALRLARLPNTILHPYPKSHHPIVQWLVDNQEIDEVMASLFAGGLPVDTPAEAPR
jgi:pimeloyl-ACP methyl ester carboxylesterase